MSPVSFLLLLLCSVSFGHLFLPLNKAKPGSSVSLSFLGLVFLIVTFVFLLRVKQNSFFFSV